MSTRDLTILGSSSQQPTRTRNHGAYFMRWNNEGFLLDPGEGTQRQFIFANIAPTSITRIFISHFHGDHCLGLGSIFMRLNLDKVTHPIHCYYPAAQEKYFNRLRYSTIYHDSIHVIEHPIHQAGIVDTLGEFEISACFLQHRVECIGWRIQEKAKRRFDKQKLQELNIKGHAIKQLLYHQQLQTTRLVTLDEVSYIQPGKAIAMIMDTAFCPQAITLAHEADILLCESTYTQAHAELAEKYSHLTAKQAATIARDAHVKQLILTHFSARYSDTSVFLEEARSVFAHTFLAEDCKRFNIPR